MLATFLERKKRSKRWCWSSSLIPIPLSSTEIRQRPDSERTDRTRMTLFSGENLMALLMRLSRIFRKIMRSVRASKASFSSATTDWPCLQSSCMSATTSLMTSWACISLHLADTLPSSSLPMERKSLRICVKPLTAFLMRPTCFSRFSCSPSAP